VMAPHGFVRAAFDEQPSRYGKDSSSRWILLPIDIGVRRVLVTHSSWLNRRVDSVTLSRVPGQWLIRQHSAMAEGCSISCSAWREEEGWGNRHCRSKPRDQVSNTVLLERMPTELSH
jgi:hypothetical protein